jgi:hypothetical protein
MPREDDDACEICRVGIKGVYARLRRAMGAPPHLPAGKIALRAVPNMIAVFVATLWWARRFHEYVDRPVHVDRAFAHPT